MTDRLFLKALEAAVCAWQSQRQGEPSRLVAPVLTVIEQQLQIPPNCPCCGREIEK